MAFFFHPAAGLDIAVAGNRRHDLASDKGYFKKIIMFNKSMLPLVFVFLVCAALTLAFRSFLQQHGFSWEVLSGGNLFIYVVTVISMHLLSKGMTAERTQVFIRNAYSGIMVKFFACAAGAFIYILINGKNLNKPSLFGCMFLYLVYTAVELTVIMKQSNAGKNAKV